MEQYSEYCQQEVYWKIRKLCETKISKISNLSTDSFFSRLQFNLHFSCRTLTHHWVSDHDSVEFVGDELGPVIENLIHIHQLHDLCSARTRETIQRTISDWPVSDWWRSLLIEDLLLNTQDMVSSVSPECNQLNVAIAVMPKHNRIHIVDDDTINAVMQHSMEEGDSTMVPATDSSIDSLESKTMDCSNESCSICLEEFSTGCKAACMPCSHVFHKGCIAEWLRTSHYCPLCRLEMPTE